MKTNSKVARTVKALATATAMAATMFMGPAHAGGLFGNGGLIGGWVGKQLDPVEEQVLTPFAQGVTQAFATGAGAVIGGEFGQPAIGAMAGNCFGRNVNSAFAGRGGASCVGAGAQGSNQGRPALGNLCYTDEGVFGPGPANPIGSLCFADTPYGEVRGRVGR